MALTLTRRQLTNDLTEFGGTGPKSFKGFLKLQQVPWNFIISKQTKKNI